MRDHFWCLFKKTPKSETNNPIEQSTIGMGMGLLDRWHGGYWFAFE